MSTSEDEEIERVAHHPEKDDESQVVEIEKVETLNGERNCFIISIIHVYGSLFKIV